MRMFFALKPDPQSCLDIERWRERTLPPLDRPVPAGNFHMTLVFLGDVEPRRLDTLLTATDGISATSVRLRLDQLGYFPGPQILWIGPAAVPDNATRLVRALRHACHDSGVSIASRRFIPHITIARRCRIPPPASAEPPSVELEFDSFCLFESIDGRSGVRYQAASEWPLLPAPPGAL